ncbi:MAG: phosphotransferase [Deltaproteobacteria bacterium]|nr:phosphotransferase [Deltaproteobacteria bacterium]
MPEFESVLSERLAGEWGIRGPYSLDKLKGDASYRSYYRVHAGGAGKTFVLMQWDPALTSKAEEIAKGAAPAEFPFLNIQRYLGRGGVRVPGVVSSSVKDGLILLEDLGDVTLETTLAGKGLHERRVMYEEAVRNLVAIQSLGERDRDPACLAFQRVFDRDLYVWEFNHYVEYGIEARSGSKVPPADRALMDEWFERLSDELDAIPKGFTHRDYQSRNLMACGGAWCLIDFQDALLGPPQYDLVALLKDSYVDIGEDDARHLVSVFLAEREKAGLPIEDEAFWRGFKVQTIQRKLKDAGRFIFIDRVKKNASFLPHVPSSFEYVRRYLSTMDDLKDLHEILGRYTPELR